MEKNPHLGGAISAPFVAGKGQGETPRFIYSRVGNFEFIICFAFDTHADKYIQPRCK